jgi:hypothetical protein
VILGSVLLVGCASSVPAPLPDVWWPTAFSSSAAPPPKAGKAKRAAVKRIACPDLAAAVKSELSSTTSRPPHWPDKGATKGELEKHVDDLEASEASKVAAAQLVISEFERCRGSPPAGRKKGKPQ